ncbi:MAG: hypothetical protein V1885_02555 [Candidatus Brennerbacteria bacterium]
MKGDKDMKNPQTFLFGAVLLSCIVLIHGCVPRQARKQEAPPYVPPTFDFTPPSVAPSASAGVTFAIVNSSYSENKDWTRVWPFTDISRNMARDFVEIVNARGFTVRGPFGSYDEMIFPDKQGSDLVLQPTVEMTLEFRNLSVKEEMAPLLSLETRSKYSLKGEAVIGGRITLSLLESLSKERMWSKSIEIPPGLIPWEGEKQYWNRPTQVDLSDNGVARPIGTTMEVLYAKVMQTAWDYLNPDEMRMVKKQAEEIKKKKVY